MGKKTSTPNKNQLSFDAFLSKPAKPTAPNNPKKELPKSLSRGNVTLDAVPASQEKGTANEGTPLETGYGNAVVVQKIASNAPKMPPKTPENSRPVEGVSPLAHSGLTTREKSARTDGAGKATQKQTLMHSIFKPKIIPEPIPERHHERIIDLSNYHESTKNRIKHDGKIYFCREEKIYFKDPIITNNSIAGNDPFWNVLTCPVCSTARIIGMDFSTIPTKDFCLECGCVLEIDVRDNTSKICYNCNRDVFLIKLKKEK